MSNTKANVLGTMCRHLAFVHCQSLPQCCLISCVCLHVTQNGCHKNSDRYLPVLQILFREYRGLSPLFWKNSHCHHAVDVLPTISNYNQRIYRNSSETENTGSLMGYERKRKEVTFGHGMLPPHRAEVGQLRDPWPRVLSVTLILTQRGMILNSTESLVRKTQSSIEMLPNIATGERKNVNSAFTDAALVMDKFYFTWSNIYT